MIVAQGLPACINVPNSAVSDSNRPENGAVISRRAISRSAAATAARAASMPASAEVIPELARCKPALAASSAASALMRRVSDAKPSWLRD